MTIQEAMNTAVEGGYHLYGSDGMDTDDEGATNDYSAWTRKDNESSFLDVSMALLYSGNCGRENPCSLLCPSHLVADDVERAQEPAPGWKGTPAPILPLSHCRRNAQHAQHLCEEAAVVQEVTKDMVQRMRLARQRRRSA
jgi:hypothetical protein